MRPPLENETLDINGFGYNSIVLDTVGTIHRTFSHLPQYNTQKNTYVIMIIYVQAPIKKYIKLFT